MFNNYQLYARSTRFIQACKIILVLAERLNLHNQCVCFKLFPQCWYFAYSGLCLSMYIAIYWPSGKIGRVDGELHDNWLGPSSSQMFLKGARSLHPGRNDPNKVSLGLGPGTCSGSKCNLCGKLAGGGIRERRFWDAIRPTDQAIAKYAGHS